jgi:hypothetical protein
MIIRYWEGEEARVGDTVLIDGRQRGVVREVVDTREKMMQWGLDEFGLMFEGVFYPQRFLREFPIDLISRATT